jgi:dihydroorotate dehydrogenase
MRLGGGPVWNALAHRGFRLQYLRFYGRISRWLEMGAIYQKILRPLLFRLDSERAHELAVDSMAFLGRVGPACRIFEALDRLQPEVFRPIEAFGLRFPNAVGLAAGFDKNARAWPAAAALGFGHVEIGTVTAQAQGGNPKPRMFRYPSQEAVINRLGFNNQGAAAVADRLSRQPPRGRRRIPLGVNLGKTKVTEIDRATEDYLASFALLADHADYIVLNVSSPNTPGLRQLQDESRLRELLTAITGANAARAAAGKARVPILLKISPDLGFPEIDDVLGVVSDLALDGLIATNTTLTRTGAFSGVTETGGLSGAPLRSRSTAVIRYVSRAMNGRLPIIGVGGITDVEGAAEKLDAGATLVQVYTGMIYRGPFFASKLARGLAERQRR